MTSRTSHAEEIASVLRGPVHVAHDVSPLRAGGAGRLSTVLELVAMALAPLTDDDNERMERLHLLAGARATFELALAEETLDERAARARVLDAADLAHLDRLRVEMAESFAVVESRLAAVEAVAGYVRARAAQTN